MKKYKFRWLDGKEEEGTGIDAADALKNLGYGFGALITLPIDYYEEVETEEKNP